MAALATACTPWDKYIAKSGHGQRWDPVARKVRGAHVMAWEEANGMSVPPGMLVRHRCDNPPCVEPSHLELGSHLDNRNDLVERHPERVSPPPRYSGEQHPCAKLTQDQVRAMREQYTGARGEITALARRFGVSIAQASKILGNKAWSC